MSDYTPEAERLQRKFRNLTAQVDLVQSAFSDLRREISNVASAAWDAVEATALAEQGETEWEYGATNVFDDKPVSIRDTLAEAIEAQAFYTRERGRKTNLMMRAKAVPAGPWLPVPDTTNNESEGKA